VPVGLQRKATRSAVATSRPNWRAMETELFAPKMYCATV
jgi:hypothetical protein